MIARQPNFPNEDIIRIFMGDEPESLSHMKGTCIDLIGHLAAVILLGYAVLHVGL